MVVGLDGADGVVVLAHAEEVINQRQEVVQIQLQGTAGLPALGHPLIHKDATQIHAQVRNHN